jgi:hypothetical protein
MRHPSEGVLRRLVDEPAAVVDADRHHVADCPECLLELARAREDAALVGTALATEADADADAAWQRLTTAARTTRNARAATLRTGRTPRTRRTPRTGRTPVLRRPVVAVLAVVVVLAGAGTAAANDWLPIFRTERISAVGFSTADLTALPDLSAVGDVAVSGQPDVHEVPDAAAATAQTHLDVPEVTSLPSGVNGAPVYQVADKVSATFTFSADRAARAAKEVGKALPPPPPGLDGSRVRLVAGPGVAGVWSQSSGIPALVVGRAVAPTAFSSGVSFETVRDYLLSLPGIPPRVADQLRSFSADGSTLPLPVPADEFKTSTAQVNGLPATVLTTHDRTAAAVVWVDHGLVTAVAGSLNADEVLSIARGLR